MISKLEILDHSCFKDTLSLKEKVILGNHLELVRLEADELFCEPGDESQGCVIVAHGSLELKREHLTRIVRAYDAFGFLGALQPTSRGLIIRALEKTMLLTLSYDRFQALQTVAPSTYNRLKQELLALSLPILLKAKEGLFTVP